MGERERESGGKEGKDEEVEVTWRKEEVEGKNGRGWKGRNK